MKLPSIAVIATLAFPFPSQPLIGQNTQPHVFLQAVSHGNVWNAQRDQSMEMARDFQRQCPEVKVTIFQNNADYTVLLNHIEVGLIGRNNQFQVANRDGEMLSLREKTGIKSRSINNGVKAACEIILSDWRTNGSGPGQAVSPSPSQASEQPVSASPITKTQIDPPTDDATNTTVKSSPKTKVSPDATPASPALPSPASTGVAADRTSIADPKLRDDSEVFGLVLATSERGAQIVTVIPDGPAYLAGLHVGDVINYVDGKSVHTKEDFAIALSNRKSVSTVRVKYMFHMFDAPSGWVQGSEKILTAEMNAN